MKIYLLEKARWNTEHRENSEDGVWISIPFLLFYGCFWRMKRILESGYKDTVCYRKLKGEPDSSDSPKYAPQRRTAIHIYSIQDLNKKCKIFHREMNFFNWVILVWLSVWIIFSDLPPAYIWQCKRGFPPGCTWLPDPLSIFPIKLLCS